MEQDVYLMLGRIALKHCYVSRMDLMECLGIQERMHSLGDRRPLGQILVDQGYLDKAHVAILLERQRSKEPVNPDWTRFGDIARINGFIDEPDVARALKLQARYKAREGETIHLGEAFVLAGLLTVFERDAILDCQCRLRQEDLPRPKDRDGLPPQLVLEVERLKRSRTLAGVLVVLTTLAAAVAAVAALAVLVSRGG